MGRKDRQGGVATMSSTSARARARSIIPNWMIPQSSRPEKPARIIAFGSAVPDKPPSRPSTPRVVKVPRAATPVKKKTADPSKVPIPPLKLQQACGPQNLSQYESAPSFTMSPKTHVPDMMDKLDPNYNEAPPAMGKSANSKWPNAPSCGFGIGERDAPAHQRIEDDPDFVLLPSSVGARCVSSPVPSAPSFTIPKADPRPDAKLSDISPEFRPIPGSIGKQVSSTYASPPAWKFGTSPRGVATEVAEGEKFEQTSLGDRLIEEMAKFSTTFKGQYLESGTPNVPAYTMPGRPSTSERDDYYSSREPAPYPIPQMLGAFPTPDCHFSSSVAYSFGSSERKHKFQNIFSVHSSSPGPIYQVDEYKYNTPRSGKTKCIDFGFGERPPLHQARDTGPMGVYQLPPAMGEQVQSQCTSAPQIHMGFPSTKGPRTVSFTSGDTDEDVGPGTYHSDTMDITNPSTPRYSFPRGSREQHGELKKGSTKLACHSLPGPGTYHDGMASAERATTPTVITPRFDNRTPRVDTVQCKEHPSLQPPGPGYYGRIDPDKTGSRYKSSPRYSFGPGKNKKKIKPSLDLSKWQPSFAREDGKYGSTHRYVPPPTKKKRNSHQQTPVASATRTGSTASVDGNDDDDGEL